MAVADLTQEEWQPIFPNQSNLNPVEVSGGFSGGKLYKVAVEGKEYLVRRSTGGYQNIDGTKQEFMLHQKASDLGISPKVHYANPEKGIIAMEFITSEFGNAFDPQPIKQNSEWQKEIITLLKKVHAFDSKKLGVKDKDIHQFFSLSYRNVPRDFLTDQEYELFERVAHTPWPEGEKVVSHNDFSVANLLYDGAKFWLIDWEIAGNNHRFYDVAFFSDWLDASKQEGERLLSYYLEQEPSENQKKTFNELRRIFFGIYGAYCYAEAARISREKNLTLNRNNKKWSSLEEMYIARGNNTMDLTNPQDLYSFGIALLSASGSF